MKAYKLLENINYQLAAGRVLCPFNNSMILIATPTKPQEFISTYYYNMDKLVREGYAAEIELEDEKVLKPHYYKPIKQELGIK